MLFNCRRGDGSCLGTKGGHAVQFREKQFETNSKNNPWPAGGLMHGANIQSTCLYPVMATFAVLARSSL